MDTKFRDRTEAKMRIYQTYTPEFKLETIALAKTEGVKKTATNLGINPNIIYRWKNEQQSHSNNHNRITVIRDSRKLRSNSSNTVLRGEVC
jgi:transposase-like protein